LTSGQVIIHGEAKFVAAYIVAPHPFPCSSLHFGLHRSHFFDYREKLGEILHTPICSVVFVSCGLASEGFSSVVVGVWEVYIDPPLDPEDDPDPIPQKIFFNRWLPPVERKRLEGVVRAVPAEYLHKNMLHGAARFFYEATDVL
jgi:hypothetical protein